MPQSGSADCTGQGKRVKLVPLSDRHADLDRLPLKAGRRLPVPPPVGHPDRPALGPVTRRPLQSSSPRSPPPASSRGSPDLWAPARPRERHDRAGRLRFSSPGRGRTSLPGAPAPYPGVTLS